MSAPVMNDLKALTSRLHPRWLIAPIGTLVGAAISMVLIGIPIWAAWLTTDHGANGPRELANLIGGAWLGIQNVPLNNGPVKYSILPWGLVIVVIFALYRAALMLGRATKNSTKLELGILMAVAALTYAAVMATVAALTATQGLQAPIGQAALTGAIIAAGTFATALMRTTDQGKALLKQIPKDIKTVARAGTAGALGLLGAGAVLALISLIWHFWQAREILEFLDAGVFGGLLIVIACIGYLPVLVLWSTSYLLGPGIAIGPGIGLSPFMPTPPPTELPAFPLLAALPEKLGPLAWGLPIIAVLIGVGVGITCARGGPLPALMRLASATAACAATGITIGALTALSTGSLGDVRLLSVGPDPVFVGLLAFGLTALGAVPTALALRTVPPPEVEVPKDKYYNAEQTAEPTTAPTAPTAPTADPVEEIVEVELPQEATGVENPTDVEASATSDQESEQING
ncbi:MAG: DUF6350 family protein [Actinomycetota bacterium]|nr:DUF6350 family protein [Actinomycetota bacterium]